MAIPVRLPLHCCRHVGRSIPGDRQLDELHLLQLPVNDNQVRLLSCHRYVGGNGDAIDSVAFMVSIDFNSFQPLGSEEGVEVVHDVVVPPLKPVQSLLSNISRNCDSFSSG